MGRAAASVGAARSQPQAWEEVGEGEGEAHAAVLKAVRAERVVDPWAVAAARASERRAAASVPAAPPPAA